MNEALVAHQVELEKLYNKNQLLPRIRGEFLNNEELPFAKYIEEQGIPVDFGIDVLVQMALHKRCQLPVLVGLLRHHLGDGQKTCDMLKKCAEADLIDWSPDLKLFIVKFTISDDVQREIDMFQFPLPMVTEPKALKSNRETGYMVGGGSIILRNNHHDDDVCLDHINRMNRVRFTINHSVVAMVKNRWKHLDRAKAGEPKEDFERRKKAFAKYDRTAKDVINIITKESSTFHLTHRYDKRGRVYSMGYHVNYQGNPWNKACIEFADKELVNG